MTQHGPTKVALVQAENRGDGVRRSIETLGVNPVEGKKVLLKPNFNTADPYPASTHMDALRELIVHLRELGAEAVTIGERSGPPVTREVMEELGVFDLATDLDVEVVDFDALPPEDLVKVDAPESHWEDGFLVPRMVRDAECIVLTPCLKTHRPSRSFTMALKLAVGIVPKANTTFMKELHGSSHIRKMIGEINVAYEPDLIVLDAMEAFVDGGPSSGTKKRTDLFLAGTDRVAIDAVGVAILKVLGSTPDIMDQKIFAQEQISRAVELGIGVGSPGDIELVAGDPGSEDYVGKIRRVLDQG